MRRVFRVQTISVILHFLAAVVGKIVAAVIAFSAGDVRSHNYTVARAERDTLEIGIFSVAADRGYCANIFVALNQWELKALIAVLRGVALESVFVGAAYTGHLHFDKD